MNDIHQEIKDKDLTDSFDVSNYPKAHDLYSLQNEGKLGKFENECSGEIIEEFIGLRSKMYSVELASGKQRKAATGVKMSVAKKVLKHELYRQSLLNHPFLRPTDESCQRFQSFRECIDSCKICQTTGCTNQDRAFNVPFILNNYKNFGCSLPPVCKKLFKTESARLIEQYNIDVEASMGPKFDYVFFHHDPDLTPKKLAQMCPDKN